MESPNFSFLKGYAPILLQCAAQAEHYVFSDPNTCLIKLRQFGELLAQEIAARTGVELYFDDNAVTILNKLQDKGVLGPKPAQLFHSLRKTGNKAVHEYSGSREDALYHLRMARALAVWFHRAVSKDQSFDPGEFIPPPNPKDAEISLQDELERLHAQLATALASKAQAEAVAQKAYSDLSSAQSLVVESQAQWETEKKAFEAKLEELRAQAASTSKEEKEAVYQAVQSASESLDLSEADTRKLIDEQLREAGWEADSTLLTHGKGVRPQKGRNLAIAEWPTASGPADYVLFAGLTPIAAVEAKKKNKDVPGAIPQAKRYSRDYKPSGDEIAAGGPWGDYKLPFLFSANGRPYLKQIRTKSGIWFLDVRLPTNHPRCLEGWYTPEGLTELLDQDIPAAHAKLKVEPTDYLGLREYQIEAIRAVEQGLVEGKESMLLAMATGTGKTRTCIGLAYRLLKAKRFRRILFLVDRNALGQQATDAFKDVKLENLQSFTDIYDVKELGDLKPEPETRLQVATIQGMIRRLLYPSDEAPPPVDQYDCIIVDECHRGYNLDREMSEAELTFRSEFDYISKYSRVLDHFDAVKVGLTATPALHTTQLFGEPVYTYSYRQAVIDGYLIDHEPPFRITTALAQSGIVWKKDEAMDVLDLFSGTVDTVNASDEVKIEVEKFNKVVVTENFNRVVCEELARHIDPTLEEKTLVFCASDNHADMVVMLLKEAFRKQYGEVDDDAVMKITAATDKPLEKIRLYKNEKLPSVAVTVDLLTTGIDVPPICNLVFIRRVSSRILYEQMIGRATRRCDEIGKELFRIFDAVELYSALDAVNTMKPVVTNPQISFSQLAREIAGLDDEQSRKEVRDQFLAKFQRKRRVLTGKNLEGFQVAAGLSPQEFADRLRGWSTEEARDWLKVHPSLAEFLDRVTGNDRLKVLISHHDDEVVSVERGYGEYSRPEDYLDSFAKFIKENMNQIPALLVVTQRPKDLTRQQLKELRLLLDQKGYPEEYLRAAWSEAKNEDMAASIIGFIRQMALGSPLVPYDERIERAMKKIYASRSWTRPQRQWLERIGQQLKVETVVDRESLNKGRFKDFGGFERLNRVFDGRMDALLNEIHEEIWRDIA